MHWALKKELIGFWCFLNIIGGIEGAKNGQEKSAIEVLKAKGNLNEGFNPIIKFWICRQTLKYNENGLFTAIQENDLFALEILIENGGDLEKPNSNGLSPLLFSAEIGNENCMRILIENGANDQARDEMGRTSIHLAAEKGHLDCVRILTEQRLAINDADMYSQTPLHLATEKAT